MVLFTSIFFQITYLKNSTHPGGFATKNCDKAVQLHFFSFAWFVSETSLSPWRLRCQKQGENSTVYSHFFTFYFFWKKKTPSGGIS
jgi:hypothetical protein